MCNLMFSDNSVEIFRNSFAPIFMNTDLSIATGGFCGNQKLKSQRGRLKTLGYHIHHPTNRDSLFSSSKSSVSVRKREAKLLAVRRINQKYFFFWNIRKIRSWCSVIQNWWRITLDCLKHHASWKILVFLSKNSKGSLRKMGPKLPWPLGEWAC